MERLEFLESKLKETFDFAIRLRCFTYSSFDYPVRVICATFLEGDLEEKWKVLNNAIATTLQAQIQDPVERYNIYLLIFESHISMEVRAVIENDRYCCRKIVVTETMPENDNSLETLIENRLFRFVEHIKPTESLQSVQELMSSIDPSGELFDLIANLNARLSDGDVQRAIDILQRGSKYV